jgi:hypothetical protein
VLVRLAATIQSRLESDSNRDVDKIGSPGAFTGGSGLLNAVRRLVTQPGAVIAGAHQLSLPLRDRWKIAVAMDRLLIATA